MVRAKKLLVSGLPGKGALDACISDVRNHDGVWMYCSIDTRVYEAMCIFLVWGLGGNAVVGRIRTAYIVCCLLF